MILFHLQVNQDHELHEKLLRRQVNHLLLLKLLLLVLPMKHLLLSLLILLALSVALALALAVPVLLHLPPGQTIL